MIEKKRGYQVHGIGSSTAALILYDKGVSREELERAAKLFAEDQDYTIAKTIGITDDAFWFADRDDWSLEVDRGEGIGFIPWIAIYWKLGKATEDDVDAFYDRLEEGSSLFATH